MSRVAMVATMGVSFALGCAGSESGVSEGNQTAADGGAEASVPVCHGTPRVVRIATANLTSGPIQRYEEPGIRILQALRPDIALLQEFNYAESPEQLVSRTFGPDAHFVRDSTTLIPNGIVTHFPIVASGEWKNTTSGANRNYAWARIDVPGPRDLLVVSVHLRTDRVVRRLEMAELAQYMDQGRGNSIVVLGGDFNGGSSNPALEAAGTYLNLFSAPPLNVRGTNATNAGLSKQLDVLLTGRDLEPWEVPITIGAKTFVHGVVFTSDMAPPEAVSPALPTDSQAPGMQHMAVVRDFKLCEPRPVPEGDASP